MKGSTPPRNLQGMALTARGITSLNSLCIGGSVSEKSSLAPRLCKAAFHLITSLLDSTPIGPPHSKFGALTLPTLLERLAEPS